MKSILALRTKSSIAIKNAENGQTIRTLTVDGEVVGSPSTSGDIGYVSVKKNNITIIESNSNKRFKVLDFNSTSNFC